MDFPNYRSTKISANDLIAKIQPLKGWNTTSMHHDLRRRDAVAFDAGFSAAIMMVWDLILEAKRAEFNDAAVKHNNSVDEERYKISLIPMD